MSRFEDLPERVRVMGVLNVTPDSFSDGGRFLDPERAVEQAWRMLEEGADLVDIGGASSRPGSVPPDECAELDRILPVLRRLQVEGFPLPISIDTFRAVVAERAIDLGAGWVNDITALHGDPEMLPLVCRSRCSVVLMHMPEVPASMQRAPRYDDVVEEVRCFLADAAGRAVAAGVGSGRIWVDPGIGFGKRLEHNLLLLRSVDRLGGGFPVLIGPSRKSFIGEVLDLPLEERLEGTLAVTAVVVWQGARMVRVHDVRPAVRVVRMVEAIRSRGLASASCG
jgi:dihydropteroate synthase